MIRAGFGTSSSGLDRRAGTMGSVASSCSMQGNPERRKRKPDHRSGDVPADGGALAIVGLILVSGFAAFTVWILIS
jgi:hypothetical protein